MVDGDAYASRLAIECGVDVEVASEASSWGGSFAAPTGGFVYRSGVDPYRALDDLGRWAAVDTNLEVLADGTVRPVNTVTDLVFSGGGTGPFAVMTHAGKGLSFTWPGVLPAPSVSGSDATYVGVLPGVDLVVHAGANGFSHDLVVHSAEAAADPRLERIEFGVDGDGLAVAVNGSGAVMVTDSGTGAEFASTAPPLMWDTPSTEPSESKGLEAGIEPTAEGEQQIAPVTVETTDVGLALIPDPLVLNGPDTQYPVIIDPLWTGGKRGGDWGSVWSKFPTQISWQGSSPSLGNGSTYGNAGAGQTCDSWTSLTCTSSTYKIRSFFRMNTEGVTRNDNRALVSAKFKILQRHSADCSAGKAKVWHTDKINSTDSWNSQPGFRAETAYSTASANHGAQCAGGPKYAEFNVTNMAQVAKTNKWYSFTIGMRAEDETPSPDLAQWRRYDSSTAILEITYDSLPQTPESLSTDGKGCSTTGPGTWTTTMTPRLTSTPKDPDGGTVTTKWRLYSASGGNNIREWTVTSTAGKAVTTIIPTGAIPAEGDYVWRVRTEDANNYSDFSGYCYFRVDDSPPASPTATLLTDDPILGQPIGFQLNGPIDTTTFVYAVTGGATKEIAATNGTAALTITPPTTSIDHVLQLWARDAAGNLSDRFDRSFTTRLPTEIAWWPLAGDGADATGSSPLTLPATATWTPSAFNEPGKALHLDGSSCAATAGPVVDTSKSFTVSAWAKPAEVVGTNLIVQSNEQTGGFWVRHDVNADGKVRWWATFDSVQLDGTGLITQADATEYVFDVDTWQHVSATYDSTANTFSLYVNGSLQFVLGGIYSRVSAQDTTPLYLGCRSSASVPPLYLGDVHDVRVFDGPVSAEQAGAIAAKPTAYWAMNTTGDDPIGSNTLAFHGTYEWAEDRDDWPESAYGLVFGGEGYANTAGPVARTDASFSVAAWVKLTDKSTSQTIVSQVSTHRASFSLGYDVTADRWHMTMPSANASSVTWSSARAIDAPEAGSWYHLVGVFDAAANEVRLYVNGELQGTVPAPETPWHVDGPLLIGAAGSASGSRSEFLTGSIDDVRVYTGVLDPYRITRLGCTAGC